MKLPNVECAVVPGRKIMSASWKFCFLLHNLELKEAFETKFMAIVPNNDARLMAIIDKTPAIALLIRNFTDKFGHPKFPCALIIREDAPAPIASLEAVTHFRNIFALSCLLFAWPRTIGWFNVFYPLWSDFFDFYPVGLAANGNSLLSLSPATKELILSNNNFRGQTSPNLPSSSGLMSRPDKTILRPLIEIWEKGFESPDWKTRALFRSLEMAYQAASIPSSRKYFYDFGSRIALWVSAFEVLIHPGRKKPGKKKEKANVEKVTTLLKRYAWSDSRLRKRAHLIKIDRNKKERVNLVSKLYRELYDARCDFLHGNRVAHRHLYCFHNENRPKLMEIAPIVYKIALDCCFQQFGKAKQKQIVKLNVDEEFQFDEESINRVQLEEALITTLQNAEDK